MNKLELEHQLVDLAGAISPHYDAPGFTGEQEGSGQSFKPGLCFRDIKKVQHLTIHPSIEFRGHVTPIICEVRSPIEQ